MNRHFILTILTLAMPCFAAPHGNRVIYGENGKTKQFDPYTVNEMAGKNLSDLLFDSLVDLGQGNTYTPRLAERWEIVDGNTAAIFWLKPHVAWHDSTPANPHMASAQDVIATIKALQDTGNDIPNRERFNVIKDAIIQADGSVKINFARALSDPLRHAMFKILPAHHLRNTAALKRDGKFAQHPIGTGPYRFVAANDHGEVRLQAFPEHFAGKAKIDEFIMKPFADQNVMAQSLMFSALDLVTYLSPAGVPEVAGDRELKLVPYDALSFSFLAMNTSRAPLSDKRVRQAITAAMNRQEMLAAFFGGEGRLISGPFSPSSWAYNVDVKPIAFDARRARELLHAAGLAANDKDGRFRDANGKALSLRFVVPLTGENETMKRIVLACQSYLEAAGIGVDIQFMDWLVWKDTVLGRHDYDLTIAAWNFDDANDITSLFHSAAAKAWGNNFVMFRNPQVDMLLTEAGSTNDFEKKRAIYHRLHAILADEAPYMYLWTLKQHAAHRTNLAGVRIEPFAFFKHAGSWNLRRQ